MAFILKGGPVAEALSRNLHYDIDYLRSNGVDPTIAVVRVGARHDDLEYEKAVHRMAGRLGVNVRNEVFPRDIEEADLLDELERINADESIHGILLFQPLPEHIDGETARSRISVEKDIDGCTHDSIAGVFSNTHKGFPPCTARAVMEMLHYYGVEIEGRKAAVIGRSVVIGRPVGMMLMHENATVVNCHTKTRDVPGITSKADILISAAGHLKLVTPEYTNPGQIIIDVGTNWDDEKKKTVGDVDFDTVEPIVKAITPLTAGLGRVTTCVLMMQLVEAAMNTLPGHRAGV